VIGQGRYIRNCRFEPIGLISGLLRIKPHAIIIARKFFPESRSSQFSFGFGKRA
jgi:hypothetical protein